MAQDDVGAPKSPPDFLVFTEIGIIAQLSTARLARALPAGMTTSQYSVLDHFYRRGGSETPAQLASAFQVTKAAITHTLGQLEAKGLIEVAPHGEDGRKKLVSITPEGVRAHDLAAAAIRPYLSQLREAFTDAEFQDALPFLRALRAYMDENR